MELVRLLFRFVGGKCKDFFFQANEKRRKCFRNGSLIWEIWLILRRQIKNEMANTVEMAATSGYSQVQIHALKDSLKASIDKESNIDLLRKCALLLSIDKDLYDLGRAIPMNDLLSMVKEDIHTMFQNAAQ